MTIEPLPLASACRRCAAVLVALICTQATLAQPQPPPFLFDVYTDTFINSQLWDWDRHSANSVYGYGDFTSDSDVSCQGLDVSCYAHVRWAPGKISSRVNHTATQSPPFGCIPADWSSSAQFRVFVRGGRGTLARVRVVFQRSGQAAFGVRIQDCSDNDTPVEVDVTAEFVTTTYVADRFHPDFPGVQYTELLIPGICLEPVLWVRSHIPQFIWIAPSATDIVSIKSVDLELMDASHPHPPVAYWWGPKVGWVGQTLTFTDRTILPGGPWGAHDPDDGTAPPGVGIIGWAWNANGLGGDINGNGPTFTPTFNNDGVYHITLEVTDNEGMEASRTDTVTIYTPADFVQFWNSCAGYPDEPYSGLGCGVFDSNDDGDVDIHDLALIQAGIR